MMSNPWNRIMVVLCIAIILLWGFVTYAHAGNYAIVTIKTATHAIKKQVRQADGTLKTVTVSRHPSYIAAVEAVKLLPHGSYTIDPPIYNVRTMPCLVPPEQGICTDMFDMRVTSPEAVPPAAGSAP